jgi:hypothetical protein
MNSCAECLRGPLQSSPWGSQPVSSANKISLLPPTQVPEVIRHLRAFASDAFCLTDDAACKIGLTLVRYPANFAQIGNRGQVNYAAAIRYPDHCTHRSNAASGATRGGREPCRISRFRPGLVHQGTNHLRERRHHLSVAA